MQIAYLKASTMSSKKGEYAISETVCSGLIFSSKCRTPDMGGSNTTHDFTRAVLDHMELEV